MTLLIILSSFSFFTEQSFDQQTMITDERVLETIATPHPNSNNDKWVLIESRSIFDVNSEQTYPKAPTSFIEKNSVFAFFLLAVFYQSNNFSSIRVHSPH